MVSLLVRLYLYVTVALKKLMNYCISLKNKIKLQAILTAAHQDFEKGLNARAYFL